MGVIYEHYSKMPWDYDRWPNFTPREMACNHCGECFYSPVDFDYIQSVRSYMGSPVALSSVHRCRIHNQNEGGAKNSQHLRIAFDIKRERHDPIKLFKAVNEAGFSSFGFYRTFIHCDRRPGRRWFSKGGRAVWDAAIAQYKGEE